MTAPATRTHVPATVEDTGRLTARATHPTKAEGVGTMTEPADFRIVRAELGSGVAAHGQSHRRPAAVFPTTNPQPARYPQKGPRRSWPYT